MSLTFDEVRRALPELDELRPLVDHLLAVSVPDPARAWAGSGELGTTGARLLDLGPLATAAAELTRSENDHLSRIYSSVVDAVTRIGAGDHAGAALAFLSAAGLEADRNRTDRAEAYAAAAQRAAEAGSEPHTTALVLRRRGRFARTQGRPSDAERLYVSGYELALAVGDREGAAEGAIGAGNALEDQGRWSASEAWYLRALEVLEATEVVTPARWHALLNLHVVTRSRGQVEESVSWLRRAEGVAEGLGDATARPFIQNAWGQLHMSRGDFAVAARHLQDALLSDRGARATVTIRLNLGEALLAQGRTLDAAEEVREAERVALMTGTVTKLPEVYRLLGRIASARGNPDALVLFERALEIVRERGLPALEEALTLQAYADAQAHVGDDEEAERLRGRALELYRGLGIEGERRSFADSYGGARREREDHAHDS